MKLLRTISLLLVFALTCPVFASCSHGTEGTDGTVSDESEESMTEATPSYLYSGKTEFEVTSQNKADVGEGVHVYDRTGGFDCTPPSEMSFVDVAVCDGIICYVGEPGERIIVPESGYAVRFCGVEQELKLGDPLDGSIFTIKYLPEKYVEINGRVIEIGFENMARTAYHTGYIFDEYWYTSSTVSNIYGSEYAVADGKVVEIKRSGEGGGNTAIPEGGYVLAVGMGSVEETRLNRVKVGDEAVRVENENLYTVRTMRFTATNPAVREYDSLNLYTADSYSVTPRGSNLTEFAVSADGTVTAKHVNTIGETAVPVGGCVISASGYYAQFLSRNLDVCTSAVIKDGETKFALITNPKTELDYAKKRLATLETDFRIAKSKYYYIDFELVDSLVGECGRLLENADESAELLLERLEALLPLLPQGEAEVIPAVTLQTRAVWITVGEGDGAGNVIMHTNNDEDVYRHVLTAKKLGYNTVIFDNTACGFAVYDSEVEGMLQAPGCDFDVLASAKSACEELGMQFYIMVNAFSSGHNSVAYPDGHYMKLYADKYLVTNKGNTAGPEGTITLDPADSEVQAFNLAVARELVEKYSPDGFQVDYIRYPLPIYYQAHNYEDFGYNDSSVSRFVKKYGVSPLDLKITDSRWTDWCRMRSDIINEYAKRLSDTVRSADPDVNVSFTCFADAGDREKYVYQDVDYWCEEGIIDALYPMIYGDSVYYQNKYATAHDKYGDRVDVITGVGTYIRVAEGVMTELLYLPLLLGQPGCSVFTVRYTSICGYVDEHLAAFRKQATPASSKGSGAAGAEHLADRAARLAYLFPESKDELTAFASECLRYGEKTGTDAEFFEALYSFEFSDAELDETVSADIAYVIGCVD